MKALLAAKVVPYLVAFLGALVLTLVLTPLVRELNRRIGMVDKPDPRRINKVPIPRGGGLALFLGVFVSYSIFVLVTGRPALQSDAVSGTMLYWKLLAIATGIVTLGYVDDKFGLPPKLKLVGQLIAAFLVWWWAGLGFSALWAMPAWLDCLLTVFWISGAVNAFNLIDGLDGLASGISLIATLGMAGTLFIIDTPQSALFYFAFAGGLLGFLRYNYNPASVFLGDSGSMLIGFTMATLPLASQVPNSFLVSVGVPMLAMGVPIFDTSLAILRRSIRHMIRKRDAEATGNDKVMTADSDHLHHRILRSVGMNQRKAAWTLYLITAAGVTFGLVAMILRSRTAGLWLLAVALACVVIFKNMARIELYDAGRLISSVAHDQGTRSRRRRARLMVPIYLVCDVLLLVSAFFIVLFAMHLPWNPQAVRLSLLIRCAFVFAAIVFFNGYRTIWSRAMLSNFLRLLLACFFGSVLAGVVIFFTLPVYPVHLTIFTGAYALLSFSLLAALRLARPIVRDLVYAMDCGHLKGHKDVSRILVYGAGLRYRTFRRELVRRTLSNNRIIVGLLDDDYLLRGQYIGGMRIEGMLHEAPEVINRLNVDTVVIACEVTDEKLAIIREILKSTGVKLTRFTIGEMPLEG